MVPRRRFPTTDNESAALTSTYPHSAYTGVRMLEKTPKNCHFSAHLQARSCGSGQYLNRVNIRRSDVTLGRPGDSKTKWQEAPQKLPLFSTVFVHYLKSESDEDERLAWERARKQVPDLGPVMSERSLRVTPKVSRSLAEGARALDGIRRSVSPPTSAPDGAGRVGGFGP